MKRVLGFTLIEVMVATLLMALMGVLLMASINSSINAKDSVEKVSDRYRLVRQALTRMAREISMAYLSKNINASEPAYVTQFKGQKDSLYFSAFGHVIRQKDAKQSDQQVLGFYLGMDKSGEQSLMRRMGPNLNRDVKEGGMAQVLCPNVTKLEFSYFDDRLNKWEDTWIADSTSQSMPTQNKKENKEQEKGEEIKKPSSKSYSLPSSVRISMTADMGDGVSMTWVTETEIMMEEPLDLN